jgi:xanthine dehydrogenase YagS FAD-binding subunit
VPLRLAAVETALQGKPASATNIADAAALAASGAKPLPMTGYKLDLLKGVVHDLLERLAG